MADVTVAQFIEQLGLGTPYDDAEVVTIVDSGENIRALTPDQLALLADFNVDAIKVGDGTGALTLTVAQAGQIIAEGVAVEAGAFTVEDSAGNLADILPATIVALGNLGVTAIDVDGDGVLTLSKAQYNALDNGLSDIALTPEDYITLRITADDFADQGIDDLQALGANGIDVIDIEAPGVLTLALDQFVALGTVGFAAANTVTVTMSAAVLETFDAEAIAALAFKGADTIDVASGDVTFSAEEATTLADLGLTVASTGSITMLDAPDQVDDLSPDQIAALAAAGIDLVSVGALPINIAMDQALAYIAVSSTLTLSAGTIGLLGTAADLQNLTPTEIASLASIGVDQLLPLGGGTLTFDAARAAALADAGFLVPAGTTISDTPDNLNDLSAQDILALADQGVDAFTVGGNALTLDASQAEAFAQVLSAPFPPALTSGAITVSDTGDALSMANIGRLDDLGVTTVTVTDGKPVVLSQVLALDNAGITFTGSAYLKALASDLQAFDPATIGAIDDRVSLITILSDGESQDVELSFEQAQMLESKGITVDTGTGGDFTVRVTQANIDSLGESGMADFAAIGVDVLYVDGANVTIDAAIADAAVNGGIVFSTENALVILSDTPANFANKLSAVQIAALAGIGVDEIDVGTLNALTLNAAQALALARSNIFLTSDGVRVADTAGSIADLEIEDIETLENFGVSAISAGAGTPPGSVA